MSNRVKIGNLAAAVMKQLDEYSGLCTENMKEAVKKTAKTVKQDISENAPVRYGQYKKAGRRKMFWSPRPSWKSLCIRAIDTNWHTCLNSAMLLEMAAVQKRFHT